MTQSERRVDLPPMPLPPELPPDEFPCCASPSPANGEYREPMGEARRPGVEARNRQRLEEAWKRNLAKRDADWLSDRWKAQPEDTIGGWCVTLASIPGTPASGCPPIADFCTEQQAQHMADLHNAWRTENDWMRMMRMKVANEIYAALKERRDEVHEAGQRGWPLLTEAMVLAQEVGARETP